MRVLGISGKARFGKDTSAKLAYQIAYQEFGAKVVIWNLAHTLKARVYGEAQGELSFEDVFFNKPPKLRTLLQQVGTERGRKVFGDDFWLLQNEAFIRLFADSDIDLVIIPDIRFPNEVVFSQLGGRAPSLVDKQCWDAAKHAFGYTEQAEIDMLENDPMALISIDEQTTAYYHTLLETEFQKGLGACLRIKSNRPTLEGEAAQHESEVALDNFPDAYYTGLLVNNLDTSLDDLEAQIRPFVRNLLRGTI